MVKYYKKILVDRPWNRPNLTSNGVLGGDSFACTSLTPIQASQYDAWRLFNGIDTGEDLWSSTTAQGAFVFYNPYPLKVESFEVVNWYGFSAYNSSWYKGSVYGSNDNVNWVKLADFINESHYGSGEHWVIPVNSTGYYKYHKVQILEMYASNNYWAQAREMYITATQQVSSWAECTKAEYDQLPDDDRKIVTDVYNVFVRKKYLNKKIIETAWEQPILSSNGVWGGDSFAVDSPPHVGSYYPFYAFDGSTTGTASAISGKSPYKMYFPIAVNISNIKSVGYHDSYWLLDSYRIAYSDDDVTYTNATEILTATNHTINANINKAIGYHKYWEIVPITCSSNGWSMKELYVQAQELIYAYWQECTKEEYDQLPVDDDRKIVLTYNTLVRKLTDNAKEVVRYYLGGR